MVFEKSHFLKNNSLVAVLDGSWADFGPTWAPKWVQKGTQNATKIDQQIMLKFNYILKRKKPPRKTFPSRNGKRITDVRTLKHFLLFGCSWVPFWCSCLPLGCSWVPFWCSWAPFWCLLGAFRTLLGTFWLLLGRFGHDMQSHSKIDPKNDRCGCPKAPKK